ncbi:MAG: Uma2 family endonuclease [Candidatus Melainabacteria bacterium]|nr:Uma2 family endonuclease [Candidatus Melainabacteria bacterium]
MANPANLPKRMSVDDFLRFEESSSTKHEYLNGQIFEKHGGTLAHGAIVVNIATALRNHLKGGPCKVYAANAMVRIDANNSFLLSGCDGRPRTFAKIEPVYQNSKHNF